MSRIGYAPIALPKGVETKINGQNIEVKGPKGTLNIDLPEPITASVAEDEIIVARPDDHRKNRSLHGLSRSLVNNMVVGVTEGYTINMEIFGVGYRVQLKGKNLEQAYESAKTVRETAPGQAAIDYAAEAINKAIAALATLADYSDLSAELAKHADKLEADYTASTWTVFAAARDAANTLIETGNTSEQAVAECLMALMTASDALAPKASADSLAALKAKLEEAKALDSSIYTSQTVSTLNIAMRDANALTKEEVKDDVSVAQYEAAMKAMTDAFEALEEKADMSALQAALDEVLSLSASKYTKDSFSALASAITAAQQFLSANSKNATAEEANALIAAISSAKEALVELADLTALNAKIAEAEALKEADSSAETWKALKDAVAAAKALTAEATQKQADDALAAIDAAIKALAAPAATEPGESDILVDKKEGCGGVIGATAVVLTAVIGLGAVALKKREN